MKNTLSFLFAFSLFFNVNCNNVEQHTTTQNTNQKELVAEKSYKVEGKVELFEVGATVKLSEFDPISQSKNLLGKGKVNEEGNYQIEFEIEEASLLRMDFPGGQYTMLAIDENQKNIEVNVEGKRGGYIKIKGSPDSEKLLAYDEFRAESNARLIRPTYAAMRAAGKTNSNPAEEIKAVEAYVKASNEHRKELIDFTEEHIGTSIALLGTVLRWTGDEEIKRLDDLVDKFKAKHPNLKMTKVMDDKVARYERTAIGAMAPAIAEKNQHGEMINLKDAKGKITLIDFWASWCGPCLRQVPDLMDAYDLYHDKGFEIFGVSVDSKEEKWKASIEKYEMPWPNVSDLKGWGSKTAADYNATFIPFNVLLDSDGKIIAKNLHSKELQKKLGELLK